MLHPVPRRESERRRRMADWSCEDCPGVRSPDMNRAGFCLSRRYGFEVTEGANAIPLFLP
jgi:hypothetical protein